MSLQIEKIETAIQIFNRALKLRPNFDNNLLLVVEAYAQNKQIDQALKMLETILKVNYRSVKAHAQLTLIYIKQDNTMNKCSNGRVILIGITSLGLMRQL